MGTGYGKRIVEADMNSWGKKKGVRKGTEQEGAAVKKKMEKDLWHKNYLHDGRQPGCQECIKQKGEKKGRTQCLSAEV